MCIPGGFQFFLVNSLCIALANISDTKVDFPLPETPDTDINLPSGNSAVMFFKLFSFAPLITIFPSFPFLLTFGYGTFNFPDKYLPVIDFLFFDITFQSPAATIFPPSSPAPQPISIR